MWRIILLIVVGLWWYSWLNNLSRSRRIEPQIDPAKHMQWTTFPDFRFQPVGTKNLAFQIWGSALIEPQILQSKCSEQLCRILGSSQLEPRIRQFGQMVSEVKLNCVFQGLKMAKKWLFQIFHGVQTYKKYILQKKWSKNLIPAPGNGESNLPPLIWGCHRQLDDRHQ